MQKQNLKNNRGTTGVGFMGLFIHFEDAWLLKRVIKESTKATKSLA